MNEFRLWRSTLAVFHLYIFFKPEAGRASRAPPTLSTDRNHDVLVSCCGMLSRLFSSQVGREQSPNSSIRKRKLILASLRRVAATASEPYSQLPLPSNYSFRPRTHIKYPKALTMPYSKNPVGWMIRVQILCKSRRFWFQHLIPRWM